MENERENEITYRKEGDYYVTNLVIPKDEYANYINQIFKGKEVSAEECNDIGMELANNLWGDKYQVLVCTHIDKDNVHNHIILNSVSFIDGSKYHNSNVELALLRETNDDLCIKYGLSVVETDKANREDKIAESRIANYNRNSGKMELIKKNIDEGRQIYVVCPLVEEKEEDENTKELRAVKEWTKIYKEQIFPEYRVECVYGKMKPKEIDILVSTTVIEVGVNVPNANIMVVENADRFGLAQLHQLRGRVGREQYQSYCVLKYNSKCSQVGKERMKTMQETNDGFVIAEKDLKLRGTGEFFGTKQHGIPEFKIANLFVDMPMLKSVQSVALKIESEDKGLTQQKNERLRKIVDNKLKQSVSL